MLSDENKYFIGIDIGSSFIKMSLYDFKNENQLDSISFPDNEVDLYNELMRESALTYSPIASVCRRHMKRGMKDISFKEKYCSTAK